MKAPLRASLPDSSAPNLVLERFAPEETFKTKVYAALKNAIINMDIYGSREPTWIDERQLSERLGVSRTPVREAVAMLEQEGFVKSLPRRGIVVLKKTKNEVVEMIQAWAALESMAARLVVVRASDAEIGKLRTLFKNFNEAHKPAEHVSEYSSANIVFHQTLIGLSGSQLLIDMTNNLLLHVRGIRQMTIGRDDRASRSIVDHLKIIEALERRDIELAERLSRDHTLGLAAYVDEHADIFD
ncbi:GntR family transcriptional regulator [Phreatobacter stygius]|uniref:GntR family transcriptional regulator n=1 Tax=Phreatobacter stygius TaxID=1940610 RepID=A0A4D7B1K5_9HYPH|nr:GntR family transcriptional regulator [Phreatobacter stygius]QCI64853.1 GntR family transcriptional regulator [Phreatobacter stygius]